VPLAPLTPTATPTATPRATRTRELASHGFSFGLRLAVGVPLGQLYGQKASVMIANNLGDEFGVLLLATVDAGYRLSPHWYVGGYFSAGLGTSSTDCKGSAECSLNDLRLGVDAKYLVAPAAFVDPWFGAGLGWEIANEATDFSAGHVDGPELFHLRAGLDFKASSHFSGGPEVMFTFGEFTDKPNGDAVKLHDWLTLGVSGHFDL
jgi:hypothetical protein